MATGTRAQKHSEDQMALLMQMINEGQQQQQERGAGEGATISERKAGAV